MAGRLGTEHAIAWADVWMPVDIALGDVAKRVARFRAAVADAGRPPMPIVLTAWGDPAPDTLRAYRDLGIDRAVLGAGRTGWDEPATTLPFVDRYAPLAQELAGS
jgi:hypothetical protein